MNNANEITLKIKCDTMDEFYKLLENKGFSIVDKYFLDDIYFIPEDLKLSELSIREILSKAILVRNCMRKKPEYRLTFKKKDINKDGTILNQIIYNVNILDKTEGINFVKAIGYKQIMQIKEIVIVYEKDGFQIDTKNIENMENLIEVEIVPDDERYNTIEKLKETLIKFDLPLYMDNFFVKKAEIELEKILKDR